MGPALEMQASVAKVEVRARGIDAVISGADYEGVAGVAYGGVKRGARGGGQRR